MTASPVLVGVGVLMSLVHLCGRGAVHPRADETDDERRKRVARERQHGAEASAVTDEWSELATQLAVQPGLVTRLLRLHVDDGNGLCRSCTTPGRGTPRDRWPCSIATLAGRARDIRAAALKPLRDIHGTDMEIAA